MSAWQTTSAARGMLRTHLCGAGMTPAQNPLPRAGQVQVRGSGTGWGGRIGHGTRALTRRIPLPSDHASRRPAVTGVSALRWPPAEPFQAHFDAEHFSTYTGRLQKCSSGRGEGSPESIPHPELRAEPLHHISTLRPAPPLLHITPSSGFRGTERTEVPKSTPSGRRLAASACLRTARVRPVLPFSQPQSLTPTSRRAVIQAFPPAGSQHPWRSPRGAQPAWCRFIPRRLPREGREASMRRCRDKWEGGKRRENSSLLGSY